jgi:hypothetical protein
VCVCVLVYWMPRGLKTHSFGKLARRFTGTAAASPPLFAAMAPAVSAAGNALTVSRISAEMRELEKTDPLLMENPRCRRTREKRPPLQVLQVLQGYPRIPMGTPSFRRISAEICRTTAKRKIAKECKHNTSSSPVPALRRGTALCATSACVVIFPNSASDMGFAIIFCCRLNATRPDPCPLWCPRRGAPARPSRDEFQTAPEGLRKWSPTSACEVNFVFET